MAAFYGRILNHLFGNEAEINVYSLEEETLRNMTTCDLYLNTCTSYELARYPWARAFLPDEERMVQSSVTFTKEMIRKLQSYPAGTEALLVNQNIHMALESISQLYHLGISNISFTPYAPEVKPVPEAHLAFVLQPVSFPEREGLTVVDLGVRWLSANTISEIALKLGSPLFLDSREFARYTERLAEVDYSLQKLSADKLSTESKLKIILDTIDAGIVCVDSNGCVNLVNRAAQEMLGIPAKGLVGKPAGEVLPEISFFGTRPEGASLIEWHGQELSVSIKLLELRNQSLGAFATLQRFDEEEHRQSSLRLQKTKKPYQAHYTFDDIFGSSPAIEKARTIARRMAGNDASVLIVGESGTGKEMFAQAIHNASARKEGPFIAVNCAALTETLLESELFGYTEGAFTGASKKGKPGLFECAHTGTLFLDEIETMSPSLQAKLLRVLQEREVVRIGSVEPIPIDVRVLSASNEDLLNLVKEGKFRTDLYYRLNVIPLRLPPLRDRREDILPLADYFCRSMGVSFHMSDQARAALLQHRWPGNIRELHNCIAYLRYMGYSRVELEDLPEQFHYRRTADPLPSSPAVGTLLPQEWQVMEALGELYGQHQGLGRQGIVSACAQRGYAISEHEVRLALQTLQHNGWLKVSRGRGGTTLSEQGYAYYRELIQKAASAGKSSFYGTDKGNPLN